MNFSNQLIETYKRHLSLTSNTAVGEKLGVKQQTVSMWVHGKSHPNAEAIAAMCKATGEPLSKWLPLIEAERCRTEGDRKVWLRLAQAAAAIAAAFLMLRHGVDTHAVSAFVFSPVYIMRNYR